jgi:hypothetical protein
MCAHYVSVPGVGAACCMQLYVSFLALCPAAATQLDATPEKKKESTHHLGVLTTVCNLSTSGLVLLLLLSRLVDGHNVLVVAVPLNTPHLTI